MQTRLQKILSSAGIASRRAAEQYITDGRVTVNGATVTTLGSKADPDTDDVRVDGRRVKIAGQRRRYILLYKPRGYITSRSDPERRPTVIDLLAKGGVHDYVYPVGRLDFDSEGLLLLTSDGDLAARLTHPRHGVEREYEVRVLGTPDDKGMERLRSGIMIEGRRTEPAQVDIRNLTPGGHAVLTVIIHEGRNRQIRKMCEAIGHPVSRLRRVRIGPIRDVHIRAGEFRDLDEKEIAALKRAAAGAATRRPDAPTRLINPSRSAPGARPRRSSRSDRPRRG
jgi:23S rRNA pseudouridine2605 synthase